MADNKDGTYDISLKPEKAGSFQLVLSMEGLPSAPAHKRTYSGMCAADVAAAEKCAISGVMTQLVAGQPGKLTLTRADRLACFLLPYRALGMIHSYTLIMCLSHIGQMPLDSQRLLCTVHILAYSVCDVSRSVRASVM